jgi:hypothetical protein
MTPGKALMSGSEGAANTASVRLAGWWPRVMRPYGHRPQRGPHDRPQAGFSAVGAPGRHTTGLEVMTPA